MGSWQRIVLLLAAIAALAWALSSDAGGGLPPLPNAAAAIMLIAVAFVYLRR